MSSAIDSLWDDPVVEEVPKRHKTPLDDSDAEDYPRPTKRARQSLFLPGGSDDEDAPTTSRRNARQQPEKDIDIDAIFDGIDDIDDVAPLKVVNADELERQMEAQYRASRPALAQHQILPSSSPGRDTGTGSKGKGKGKDDEDGEKKTKRRPMLLNEGLLLGPTGFPQLIKDVKDFKVKGKGHEASDLNRLLGIYQFWSHKMYPKTQFRDTVSRVEKLCHSKRMTVALSVWRDEAKGVTHKDDEDDEDEDMETDEREPSQPEVSRENSEGPGHDSRSSSPPPSRPATSASEYDVDDIFDDDLDALLREEQESSNSRTGGGISSSTSKATVSTDATSIEEDDGFWAALDDMGADQNINATSKPPPPPQKDVSMDEDQDMWDIVDEVAKESASAKAADIVPQPSPPRPPPPPPPQEFTNPDDWDDMYL